MSTVSDQRPWAIRRWCLIASVVLALVAEGLLVAAVIIALLTGNRNIGLLILPFFWALLYGGVWGMSYGIARIDQRGPVVSNFPSWYQRLIPSWAIRILNVWYAIAPNVALLIFPLFMAVVGLIVVWVAATGKLNP